jgi:bifunctional dethiobiotin synthetase / adenosylmethionine---8-amino-7-oxononanoate aminotransferase
MRLVWLDYPTIKMVKGNWMVEIPQELNIPVGGPDFKSLDDVFAKDRDQSSLYTEYKDYITKHLESLRDAGHKFGALILEPVVLGAGGMIFADPLFQRVLIETIRKNPHLVNPESSANPPAPSKTGSEPWSGLPVIFDEVFVGIHRLGRFNCNTFLHANPDIVVNAKLLTGGLIPLCTTTASQEIFDAFLSDSKADALLHGHSYTAHAVGCQVALETLSILKDSMQVKQHRNASPADSLGYDEAVSRHSVWSDRFLRELSSLATVRETWALGTVLAITLQDAKGGYVSTVADKLQRAILIDESGLGRSIHARVLGNVIYFMTNLTVEPATVRGLETRLLEQIQVTYG